MSRRKRAGSGHCGKRLSAKRRRFIAEYLRDGNATQGAIRAGYSPKTANEQAARLLANVSIRRELERRLARYDVTAERVLAELARIAFANIQDYVVTDEDGKPRLRNVQDLSRDDAAGLVKWSATRHSVRIQLDKVAALERLGKHLRLFTDKVQVGADMDLAAELEAGRRRVAEACGGSVTG